MNIANLSEILIREHKNAGMWTKNYVNVKNC